MLSEQSDSRNRVFLWGGTILGFLGMNESSCVVFMELGFEESAFREPGFMGLGSKVAAALRGKPGDGQGL